jgi:hypothetical protein
MQQPWEYSRGAVATGAAAAGALSVGPRNPMTVYNRYSLQINSNKKYRFLITVTNDPSRILTRYFESQCEKPNRHLLHRYSYFPKQE